MVTVSSGGVRLPLFKESSDRTPYLYSVLPISMDYGRSGGLTDGFGIWNVVGIAESWVLGLHNPLTRGQYHCCVMQNL